MDRHFYHIKILKNYPRSRIEKDLDTLVRLTQTLDKEEEIDKLLNQILRLIENITFDSDIDNNYYKKAATGFFINRTVFSVFLVFCLLGSLQYLKMYNFNNKKKI